MDNKYVSRIPGISFMQIQQTASELKDFKEKFIVI